MSFDSEGNFVPTTESQHYYEPVEPHKTGAASTVISVTLSIGFFALLIVGIVQAHQQVVLAGVILAYAMIIAGPIAGIILLAYPFWHKYHLDKIRREHASLDVQAKREEIQQKREVHEVRLYLAQSRLQPDINGNRPYVFNPHTSSVIEISSGNFPQPVPSHLHLEYNNSNTSNAGIEQGLIAGPMSQQKPTISELVEQVQRNSLSFGLGRSMTSQEYITSDLEDKHIKVIGATRMGKSCMIAAIIEQLRQTHDRNHLQLAILDLEDRTGRLFEGDDHILKVRIGETVTPMHARNSQQVASYLIILHTFMNWRYAQASKYGEEWLDSQPHVLIYLEEFLYWKRTLSQFVEDEKTRNDAMSSLNGIATRGLKAGIHLALAAQVDYADKDFADAMAQFVGVNVSFAVKPSAARAAGFVSTELLNQNFEAKQPGQYVVEMVGGSDIGVAPDFDVKALVKALPRRAQSLQEQEPIQDMEPGPVHVTESLPTSIPALAPLPLPVQKPSKNVPTLQDAIEVWNTGIHTVKGLEEALRCSHPLAYKLYQDIQKMNA